MAQTEVCKVVESGCDWITATATAAEDTDALSGLAFDLQRGFARAGDRERPWGMSGFSGRACGQCQWGVRGSEVLIRLSGATAHRFWREIYPHASNISRFDVQFTLRVGGTTSREIARHYRQARRHLLRSGARHDVSYYSTLRGSPTLYLGRRSSVRFGRVYCKDRESGQKQYAGCVRYELEAKEEMAQLVARTLYATRPESVPRAARSRLSRSDGRSTAEALASIKIVRGFFEDRGLVLPFKSPALQLQLSRVSTSLHKQLTWLNKQVAPALARLLEAGHEQEVLEALGLAHLKPKSPRHKSAKTNVRENLTYVM